MHGGHLQDVDEGSVGIENGHIEGYRDCPHPEGTNVRFLPGEQHAVKVSELGHTHEAPCSQGVVVGDGDE